MRRFLMTLATFVALTLVLFAIYAGLTALFRAWPLSIIPVVGLELAALCYCCRRWAA